jgi:hypothetical protein
MAAGARTFLNRPLSGPKRTAVDVMNSWHVDTCIQEIEDRSMVDGGIIPLREIFNLPRPNAPAAGKLNGTSTNLKADGP